MSIRETSRKVAALLKERHPRKVDGVPMELHPLPPFCSKLEWEVLGDTIRASEQPNQSKIGGEQWISLRCDGTGFSKLTRRLCKEGVFDADNGYSADFANIMNSCCRELMMKFSARCGYTQSDELTILLAPASVVRGEQHPHKYSGRLQKLSSLAAATVTARFHYELMALCARKEENLDLLAILQSTGMPTFDCRVGTYDREEEAMSLILWRAYDCGVNAVSDAVYKSGIPGAKQITGKPTGEKLRWLAANDLLPLPAHQRDGSFWVKRRRVVYATDHKTGNPVTCLRQRIEQVEGNVLQLFKEGVLFPPDEELEKPVIQVTDTSAATGALSSSN